MAAEAVSRAQESAAGFRLTECRQAGRYAERSGTGPVTALEVVHQFVHVPEVRHLLFVQVVVDVLAEPDVSITDAAQKIKQSQAPGSPIGIRFNTCTVRLSPSSQSCCLVEVIPLQLTFRGLGHLAEVTASSIADHETRGGAVDLVDAHRPGVTKSPIDILSKILEPMRGLRSGLGGYSNFDDRADEARWFDAVQAELQPSIRDGQTFREASSGFHTRWKPRPVNSFTFNVANSVTPWVIKVRAVRAS